MTWTEVGEFLITQQETILPVSFESPALAVKAVDFTQLRATWNWAGYFIQAITVPVIGQIRIEERIYLSTKEASLVVPKLYESNYQLIFYKAEWIPELKLTIYENSMGLNTGTDSIVFPNNRATAATSSATGATATSAVLLAANANRKSYLIENNSNQPLYIDFAATVSIPAHAVKIPAVTPGGIISSYQADNYTGVISGITATGAAGTWNIREFV
jgi:hypothetical protein